MNLELKNRWIKALLSGNYKSSFSVDLRNLKDEYSALGVLLDLNDSSKWLCESSYYYRYNYDKKDNLCLTMLSDEYLHKFNLDWGDMIDIRSKYNKSFNELADWIEENIIGEE